MRFRWWRKRRPAREASYVSEELADALRTQREARVDLERAKLRYEEASGIKNVADELSDMIMESFRLRK